MKRYTALVEAQRNPFVYGRPISREEDLADREEEKRALVEDALSGQPVMMHAPRRYGKTSLVRVVARKLLEEHELPFVYADLWGARSITDLVEVLGEAYSKASGLLRARRSLAELLRSVGFEVSVGGVLSVRYEPRGREGSERGALRELLRVPQRMAERSPSGRLLLVLDEFGELNDVPEEPDALMRSAFQNSPDVSFVFLGSKRSLMDALFSDRRRPFYNFGRRTTLGRLGGSAAGSHWRPSSPGAADRLPRLRHRGTWDGRRSGQRCGGGDSARRQGEGAGGDGRGIQGRPGRHAPLTSCALRGSLQGTYRGAALENVPQAPRHSRLRFGAQRLAGVGGRG